jgi:ornithine lipid ester-linked acyl 2-hydroxylase
MTNPDPQLSPPPPNLREELRRIWNWLVFLGQLLGRVGGMGAWVRAIQRIVGILRSRGSAQPPATLVGSDGIQHPFYPASEFAFAALLEANWQTILREVEQLQGEHFIPWVERYLYKEGWNTFGLYAFGLKIEKNCDLCPETTWLIEQIPNLVSAGFSALAPGTHITPHTGYPEGVLRCHLGLVVPENCAIRVDTEVQAWAEGKCLIFDDTLEHEAWNKSEQTRVVLLLDFQPQRPDATQQ